MAQKIFVVEGRQFRTESDYACARHDKEIIDGLRARTDFGDREALEKLLEELRGGKYKFLTLLGQDFKDEVVETLKKIQSLGGSTARARHGKYALPGKKAPGSHGVQGRGAMGSPDARGRREKRAVREMESRRGAEGRKGMDGRKTADGRKDAAEQEDAALEEIVAQELRKREKRRRLILLACSAVAVCCLGYFAVYSYQDYRTRSAYEDLSDLKEKPVIGGSLPSLPVLDSDPLYTLDSESEPKEVLDEYKNLLLKNRKLIGWVKIDGTNIDYPVMQTTDNEYYLTHNMEQEKDKNGTIFMDKDCDVLEPSTNFILYGHHMQSGRMFGQLDLYKDKKFCEEHPYISFDTIYEKGTYQVMYAFLSKVYKETEIVFKYYQFIDANGEQEFDSYMEEMAALSLYDTGVTAVYGDQLLTLSTCDYYEKDGRFVVVAKKVEEAD